MACRIMLLFLLLFSFSRSADSLSASDPEFIVGGQPADRGLFKYQVSILTRRNSRDRYFPTCGGGIVNEYFVVSAAHCFLSGPNSLRNLTFFIIASADNLHYLNGAIVKVEVIYAMSEYNAEFNYNDIAVLKLKNRLQEDKFIAVLELPPAGQSFTGNLAVIAGFGYNWVEVRFDATTQMYERADGSTDNSLKYGMVYIIDDDLCEMRNPIVNRDVQMCGLMLPNLPERRAGICIGDSGSPLVVRNSIVGIAVRNSPNCDDTYQGCIYTKISPYVQFIEKIIEGLPTNNTIAYPNPSL